jgi:hypothetical protein
MIEVSGCLVDLSASGDGCVSRLLLAMGIRTLALGLALLASGAGAARGACGDWLADHTSEDRAQHSDRGSLSEFPCPCEGPACRNSPLLPPAAPPAKITTGEQSGIASLAGLADEWSRAARFAHPQDDDRLAEIFFAPLPRPPRG